MTEIISFVLACIVLLSPLFPGLSLPEKESAAIEFAESLGTGWNLGNTMDAYSNGCTGLGTETVWGNPKTTKEMFVLLQETGFSTVRIPITWNGHFSETENYTIDSAWMDRVQELTDWALECGLKVILDVHHDDKYWLIPDNAHISETEKILCAIWQQVAERFSAYDERLVFETMNEPRVVDVDWEWRGNDECYACINRLNASAVRTIREVGGKNAKRYILCPTYAGSDALDVLDAYVRPDDDRVIVMVHNYVQTIHPGNEGDDCEKGATLNYKTKVDESFAKLYRAFISKGVAVVVDEFGWTDQTHIENRIEKTKYYVKAARAAHIPVCVWDDGGSFRMMNRKSVEWFVPDVASAFCLNP